MESAVIDDPAVAGFTLTFVSLMVVVPTVGALVASKTLWLRTCLALGGTIVLGGCALLALLAPTVPREGGPDLYCDYPAYRAITLHVVNRGDPEPSWVTECRGGGALHLSTATAFSVGWIAVCALTVYRSRSATRVGAGG